MAVWTVIYGIIIEAARAREPRPYELVEESLSRS